MNKQIYLSPPHLSGEEKKMLIEALDSNWIAPLGPHVDAWQQELGNYLDSQHVALFNSGTSSIHLALKALGVGPGDEVMLQSNTHIGSANPILYLGAKPVLIDSEADTWNMDPELLEEAISSSVSKGKVPKAILVVHLYGMPAKMNEINAVASRYGIPVLEDAAEALGSTYRGKQCGSLGRIGVLSFNGNKIITTSSGGALISDDKNLIQKAKFLSNQAKEKTSHYQHSEMGYNYGMSNLLAGVGRAQLNVLDDRIAARRKNFERYKAYFEKKNSQGFNLQLQRENADSFSNRWLTCVLIEKGQNKGIHRDQVMETLSQAGIESRPHWKPMHLQPVFENSSVYSRGVSEKLFETGLCLPSGSILTDSDFERIFDALDGILK